MKNSRYIFKNFSKKILKSQAFVSVIVVCVLALGIIGTSYALYMDVDTDTDYQLVEVGDLSIGFENGSNLITLSNMTPSDDDIALKQTDNLYSFYVYNTGTYNAKFDIKLETVDGNEVDTSYIKYRLCKDNSNNCKDVSVLSENSTIHSEELKAKTSSDASNPSAYYFLRIWISNTYTVNSSKSIKLKVVIESSNTENNNYTGMGQDEFVSSFSQVLLKNAKKAVASEEASGIAVYRENSLTSVAGAISNTTEASLSKTSDDYGDSYYFRGNVKNNYVNFAGMCWRVVRIDGNSNIKLILEDQDEECSSSMNGNWNIPTTTGGSTKVGNFGYDNTTYSGKTILNYLNGDGSSQVVTYKNFQTGVLSSYLDKLVSGTWCYDDTAYTSTTGGNIISDKSTYYTNGTTFYYDSYVRLYGKSQKEPTLICNGTVLNKYSDNTDMYVGALTADEVVFAGGKVGSGNTGYYLKNDFLQNNSLWFFTMTPYYFKDSSSIFYDDVYIINKLGTLSNYHANGYGCSAFRPAIILKANNTLLSGDGTISNPYVLL